MTGYLSNEADLCERFGIPPRMDTVELIARLFAQLGADACSHLRGSFLVVTFAEGRATVARDQLGGRPLVYARVTDGVVFAEHVRDLLDLMDSAPHPDRISVARWIGTGLLPPGRSLYEGVSRLGPAHRLLLSRGGVEVERYWRPRFEGTLAGSRSAVAEHVRDEAFAAVARASEGTANPALRLSGGLDSSCVAAGLAAHFEDPQQAIALGAVFPEHPGTDESELIQATARHTGLRLRQVVFDDRRSILAAALEHMARWRVPVATPNLFVWKPVMAIAREMGIELMLDGEGGDELFRLAPSLIADRLRRGRIPSAWALTAEIPGIGTHPERAIRMRALRVFGLGPLIPSRARRWRRRRAALRSRDPLLHDAEALALCELDDPSRGRDLDGPLWWQALAGTLIDGDSALDVSAHMRREAHEEQIDRRHPFLHDLELVRAMLSVPPQMQFDALRDRVLLREGLSGYVPEAVLRRDWKSTFTPVMLAGLARDRAAIVAQLAQPHAPVREYVRGEGLDSLLELSPENPAASGRLWRAGMIDSWLRLSEEPGYLQELERAIGANSRA
jgi:asparagine synthase (glutamine-hydrolysing)